MIFDGVPGLAVPGLLVPGRPYLGAGVLPIRGAAVTVTPAGPLAASVNVSAAGPLAASVSISQPS